MTGDTIKFTYKANIELPGNASPELVKALEERGYAGCRNVVEEIVLEFHKDVEVTIGNG